MSTESTNKTFERVNASEIWPNAKDYKDKGPRPGLVRGYNPEIITKDGRRVFMSCTYIAGEPEQYFYDEFFQFYLADNDFELTGRICFRGYGCEEYDPDELDTYIIPVNV